MATISMTVEDKEGLGAILCGLSLALCLFFGSCAVFALEDASLNIARVWIGLGTGILSLTLGLPMLLAASRDRSTAGTK